MGGWKGDEYDASRVGTGGVESWRDRFGGGIKLLGGMACEEEGKWRKRRCGQG
jgi:hypothetical protein